MKGLISILKKMIKTQSKEQEFRENMKSILKHQTKTLVEIL